MSTIKGYKTGADRFATARQVVSYSFQSVNGFYLATGLNFPDALSAAAAAGAKGEPVVLVNGTAPGLDSATTQLIDSLHPSRGTVVGGPNAVDVAIQNALTSDLGTSSTVDRVAGSDRFETSALVAKDAFTSAESAYIATGTTFPDALTGSVLAATNGAPCSLYSPIVCRRRPIKNLATSARARSPCLGGRLR